MLQRQQRARGEGAAILGIIALGFTLGGSLAAGSEGYVECALYRDDGYQVLYRASTLTVVWGSKAPKEIEALRCMAREPDALARLRDLTVNATLPGQMYALVAIRALDKQLLEEVIEQYTSSTYRVAIVAREATGTALIANIAAAAYGGQYVRQFLPEFKNRVPESYGVTVEPPVSR